MRFLARKNRIAIIGIFFWIKKLIFKKSFECANFKCADVQIVKTIYNQHTIYTFAYNFLYARCPHLHIFASAYLHIKKSIFSQQIGPALAGAFNRLFKAPFFNFGGVAAQ